MICLNCGLKLESDPCPRCGRPRVLPIDYLSKMEDIARKIVQAAVEEKSFDVFSADDSNKSPLQKSISRAANGLLFWHYAGDGCIEHTSEPAELRKQLLDAIERIDTKVFRRDYGYETPSPKKLIREGLRIARQAIEGVPLDTPSYLDAVLRVLEEARDRQNASGISDDGWKDENGYILAGIRDAAREAEKLKSA